MYYSRTGEWVVENRNLHLFSPERLNFCHQGKKLKEMGATSNDFKQVVASVLFEYFARIKYSNKNTQRDIKIYLAYRLTRKKVTQGALAKKYCLSQCGIASIITKIDRRIRARKGALKREIYYQVLERIMQR